jgi:hypothetical protein
MPAPGSSPGAVSRQARDEPGCGLIRAFSRSSCTYPGSISAIASRGFLILPDVAGFGVAGVRVDLRQAQDDIKALQLRIDMRQNVNLYLQLPGAVERTTQVQTGDTAPKESWRRGAYVDDEADGDLPL